MAGAVLHDEGCTDIFDGPRRREVSERPIGLLADSPLTYPVSVMRMFLSSDYVPRMFAEDFKRVAQSVILCFQSRGLVLQSLHSVAQIGVFLVGRCDLPLLFLNGLDDGREQLAIGNAVGTISVVLPFDQRQTVFGFRSLDGFVQRCWQGLYEVLRDKAVTLSLVAIVETIGDRLKLFDKIEAEIGTERRDILLASTIGNPERTRVRAATESAAILSEAREKSRLATEEARKSATHIIAEARKAAATIDAETTRARQRLEAINKVVRDREQQLTGVLAAAANLTR